MFVNLFEDVQNVLALYKALHPEDTSVTAADIDIQTIKSVLVNTVFNDLPPLYSTLPDSEDIQQLQDYRNIRMAVRPNQRIIMLNKGVSDQGFTICNDCGAMMPGNTYKALEDVGKPYILKTSQKKCSHSNTTNVNLGYDFITDMLVLEFALDNTRLDTRSKDSFWLRRAAQSLAEALRLSASQELDIEFTELVTGFRYRHQGNNAFVDIYLYDNLSSGAGYAVGVAGQMQRLLTRAESILANCSGQCETACHQCLKHYRNQNVHGLLDRFAALELLHWGRDGSCAAPLDYQNQCRLLLPIQDILEGHGIMIETKDGKLFANSGRIQREILIYPSMWREPADTDALCISDELLRFAKPVAVKKILKGVTTAL